MILASLVAFVLSLLASALLTPAVRDVALRRRVLDNGGVRNVHRKAVPRVGGIAFVAAFFLSLAVAFAAYPSLRATFWQHRPGSFMLLGGGIAMALIGLADDLRGLRARHKLALQVVVVGALCGSGYVLREVALPGGAVLHLGLLGVPLTVLWIVGVTNAMNLIDGLDGLAGGVSVIALCGAFVLAVAAGEPMVGVCTTALAGAVIGFLFYNFHPATLFMGDTGSLFLGYFLAVALPMVAGQPGSGVVDGFVPLVALGLPVTDTLVAILRRALRGQGLFSPDRGHIHHRMLGLGLSQRDAVLRLYAVCACLAAGALAVSFGGAGVALAVLAALGAGAVWSLHQLGIFALGLRALREERSRNYQLRRAVDSIAASLHRAADVAGVLDSLRELGPAVAASQVLARIGAHSAAHPAFLKGAGALRVRFPVRSGAQRFGEVEVVWGDANAVGTEHALAVEQICESVARAVRRVSPGARGHAALLLEGGGALVTAALSGTSGATSRHLNANQAGVRRGEATLAAKFRRVQP